MDDYLQPEFYRFNQDTFHLANWVSKKFPQAKHIADLCAGCGVLGLELMKLASVEYCEFVELQIEFLPFIDFNCDKFKPTSKEVSVFVGPISEWYPKKKIDLIVMNPPYFLPNTGKHSPVIQRHFSRTLVVDDWPKIISKLAIVLGNHGHACLVLRNEVSVLNVIWAAAKSCQLNVVMEVSGKIVFLNLFALDVKRS